MYHYTDCYLDNIWLINGYSFSNSSEGKIVNIKEIDGLHEAMMNMEVGSILNMSEPFQFVWSKAGWKLRTSTVSTRRVA